MNLSCVVTYCLAIIVVSGHENEERKLEIIGGKPTNILKHPYQVTVMDDCSGVILNSRWILTSATCIVPYQTNITYFSIRTGSNSQLKGGKMYKLEQAVVHNEYDMVTYMYDFCLLKTSSPINFNKRTKSIQYATKPLKTGTKGIVSGWGQHEKVTQTYKFREVPLFVLDFTNCQKMYSGHVRDTMFCATSKNSKEGPCLWDWVDPFVSQRTLYGMYASWLIECPSAEYPSVFNDVSSVAEWISNTITN